MTSAALVSGSDKELEEYRKKLDELLKKTADDFRNNLPKLVAAAKRATKVRVYEGLPHQLFEKGQLESELKTKKTVKVRGFPFYDPAIEVAADDAALLTGIFSAGASFRTWQGPKACGGFHPDYCIEWVAGDDLVQALICFGCDEMDAQLAKLNVYCEIDKATEALEICLTKYHKQRPQRKYGK